MNLWPPVVSRKGERTRGKKRRGRGGGHLSSMQNGWIYSCMLTALQAQQKTPDSISLGGGTARPLCCLTNSHPSTINHVNYLTDGINLLKSQSVAVSLGTGGSCTAVLLALRYPSSHSHCVICPFVVAGLLKMWTGWGRAGCLWHRHLQVIHLPTGGLWGWIPSN